MHNDKALLQILDEGRLELEGHLTWGSNYTFLARVCQDEQSVLAIYKPQQGERPLWDFDPGTLCLRECAAYLVSAAIGWNMTPPTILRQGPYGLGSLQLFVDHDPEQHYFTIEGQYPEQLQRFVLFDAIINNADRKSGHILVGLDGRLWAIDHGVSFHVEPKLRTVIWEFAGEPIPPNEMAALAALQKRLAEKGSSFIIELTKLLSPAEIRAMKQRLAKLIQSGQFPQPGRGRHYPWPLV